MQNTKTSAPLHQLPKYATNPYIHLYKYRIYSKNTKLWSGYELNLQNVIETYATLSWQIITHGMEAGGYYWHIAVLHCCYVKFGIHIVHSWIRIICYLCYNLLYLFCTFVPVTDGLTTYCLPSVQCENVTNLFRVLIRWYPFTLITKLIIGTSTGYVHGHASCN